MGLNRFVTTDTAPVGSAILYYTGLTKTGATPFISVWGKIPPGEQQASPFDWSEPSGSAARHAPESRQTTPE